MVCSNKYCENKEPRAKIEGIFESVTARWNKNLRVYSNKEVVESRKQLYIYLKQGEHGVVVCFMGGPRGNESFYLIDFIRNIELRPDREYVYLCAGTINRWDSCKVDRKELLSILKSL